MYEIWVLQFRPAFFRPFLTSWRANLPSLGWRVIVALAGGSRRRLFSRVVDVRVFRTYSKAVEGIDRIKTRVGSGHPPWSEGDTEKDTLVVPVIGSDAALQRRERHRSRPKARSDVVVLRPRNGLPSLRGHAGYVLENGVITASDRRGRSRSFPLDGTENAPAEFRTIGRTDGLVDGAGNMLTRAYGVNWGVHDFVDFLAAADLMMVSCDPELPVPPLRSDGIDISTFNPMPMMSATAAVGTTAWKLGNADVLPGVVTRGTIAACILGCVGSLGFSIITGAVDPEIFPKKPPRSPESGSRRQRRKSRKRRLRRRAAGG
jgi:hypothetical protein